MNDPLEKSRFKEKLLEYITIGINIIYSEFSDNHFLYLSVIQIDHTKVSCNICIVGRTKEKLKTGRTVTKE